MSRQAIAQNRPKHQHWVPQFYLRYYATPETRKTKQPKVWIFSKDESDGDEKLTNIRNVCGQRYLYSPAIGAGDRDWTLENLLRDLESDLARIWPTLAEDYVALDAASLRKIVALFLAVTYLRHPEVRAQTESIHALLVEAYESAPKRLDGTPDVEAMEINGRSYAVSTDGWHEYRAWGKSEHDRFFAHLVRSDAMRIAEHLVKKRWSIVVANEDIFITSDKPVGLQHETKEKFGIEGQGTIIIFPICPTRLLVLDDMHSEPANQYYPLKEGNGAAFNFTIWRSASRFLITGRSIPEVLTEILSLDDGHAAT